MVFKVGDIVSIRRFKFSVRNNTNEISGHELLFSNWMVFDLQTLEKYSEKNLKGKIKRPLFLNEEKKLRNI